MASSILTQVYKEAATTSKGVVQMNRTLDKIYADQLKANKAQSKFLDDLRTKNKREEREEKKKQSDLRKLLSGRPDGGAVGSSGGGEEEGGGGLLAAITSGLGMAFNLLKDLLIDGIGKRFRGFFRGGPRGGLRRNPGSGPGKTTPPRTSRPGGRNPSPGTGPSGRNPSPGTGGPKGGGPRRGGPKGGGPRATAPVTAPVTGGPKATTPPGSGTNPPSKALNPGNRPVEVRPTTPAPPPAAAITPKSSVKELPWWKKAFNGMKNSGVVKAFKKWGGPLVTIALMVPDMVDMYNKKEYKNLTRYVIASLAGSAVAGVAGSAVTALAALVGIPTGGVGGVATFIAGMGAAITAGNLAAGKVDEWLISMGLFDEDTSANAEMPEPQQLDPEQVTGANENIDKDEAKEILEAPVQKRQRGGGIFDVPGHGQGDQVPMMLPPGAFVLNRVAAGEMFARGGSPSGTVPTLLEPGEKVFMPGDPLMGMAMMFNETFSRFQKGGTVGETNKPTMTLQKGGDVYNDNSITNIIQGGNVANFTQEGPKINLQKGGDVTNNFTNIIKLQKGGDVVTHPNTGTGYNPDGAKDYKGRPVVLSQAASESFAKMMAAGGVKGSDVTSSQRSVSYNQTVGGAKASNHLGGNAIDIHNSSKAWLKQGNAEKFGWKLLPAKYTSHDGHFDYVGGGEGNQAVPQPEKNEKGGEDKPGSSTTSSPSSGGNMFSNMFSGITDMFGGALGDMKGMMGPIMESMKEMMGPITEEMSSVMGDMQSSIKEQLGGGEIGSIMGSMKESMTSEMSGMTERIKSEMAPSMSTVSPQVSASSSQVKDQMKKIKEVMNPEEEETTIVQVMPGGSEQKQPTVEGMTADNRPFQVSTRCPSWAAADYRYDRSLNTPTS